MTDIPNLDVNVGSKGVAAAIRHEILEGHFPPGSALPSIREISKRYGVGAKVCRNAIGELVSDGLAYTRNRQGVFVAKLLPEGRESEDLQCVTIIEPSDGTRPPLNRAAYFRSYVEFLTSHQVDMRTIRAPRDGEDMSDLLPPLPPPDRQGCLLIGYRPHIMSWLNGAGRVYVIQNYTLYPSSGLPEHHSVIVNKVAGGFDAVNHLLALGHRKIGFIGSLPRNPDDPECATFNVYDGFAAALKCAAVECCPDYLASPATNDEALAMEYARAYLDRPRLPTAVLTQTDMMAICIMRLSHARGIRIPEDLSVIGFDGLEESAATEPPLTTVAVPRRALAREALQLLFDVAGEQVDEPQRRVLRCQLTVRKSTGPAPVSG